MRCMLAVIALVASTAAAQGWPDRSLRFVASPAGGTVAADIVATSPPDGYTIVISFTGPLAFGPHLLTMELLKATAGIEIVHVSFNGSPPTVTATVQGDTQMLFAVMQPLQPQIQAGRLRAIAVTSAKRFPLLPDFPTVAGAGYPGFEALAWNGILVAARTPRPGVRID